MKTKKEYPIIEVEWHVIEVEYGFFIKCPNKKCKKSLDYWELKEGIVDGEKVNRIVTCYYCGEKFRLKVKSI